MAIHGRLSIVLAFVLTGLSTLVVALRFYSRYVLAGKLGPSDWVIFLALITTWGSVAVNCYFIHFLDFSHVNSSDSLAKVSTGLLLSLWIYRLNYIVDLCLIKTSILLFFRHLASTRQSGRHLVSCVLAVVLVGSASMIVAAVFTCYPVSDAWDFRVFEQTFHGTPASQCYNPGPFWLGNAAYNLATDAFMWSLPILFFLHILSMPMRLRLAVLGIFAVGGIAIIASIIRLRVITLWLASPQGLQANAGNLMIWSQVEQNAGIIAGSIPLLHPLFSKILNRMTGRHHHIPGPALCIEEGIPEQAVMPRALIIPSPSPTIDDRDFFEMPKKPLAPIEMRPQCTWGTTIWDGTQVRQVLT